LRRRREETPTTIVGPGSNTTTTTTPKNNAPRINSNAVREVNEVSPYRYDILASDSDGDVMNYRMIEGPGWLSVTSNIVHGNAPEVSEDKIFPVKVRVSDTKDNTDQSYNLTVKNTNNIHTLSRSQLESIVSRVNDNNLVFSNSQSFATGDVIVGGISSKTPYGILRKVKSVSGNVVYTEGATLEEALGSSSFLFQQELSSRGAKLSKIAVANGISESSAPGFAFSYNFDNVALDIQEMYRGVSVSGGISFNVEPIIEAHFFPERFVKAQLIIDEKVDLNLSSGQYLALPANQKSFPLANLPPIPLGTTPFVITPRIDIQIGLMPARTTLLEVKVSQEASLSPGVVYENGSWRNLKNFSNSFDFSVSKIQSLTSIEVYAGPVLKLFINDYGLVSPGVQGGIDGNLRIAAESAKDWKLYGGLEVLIGIDTGILSRFIPNYNKSIIEFEKLLMESGVSDGPQVPPSGKKGEFTDPRDGQKYKTVKIGNQVWMAENMNIDFGPNGSFYEDNASYGEVYGRLYDFDASRRVCGEGWHLPKESEWWTLFEFLGGNSWEGVGGKMKSTEGWDSPNTGATNESGFSALPGGVGRADASWKISYNGLGRGAYFWSDINGTAVFARALYYSTGEIGGIEHIDLKNVQRFSVRCVQD